MLNKRKKFAIILFLIIALCSTICLATDSEPVADSTNTSATGETVESDSSTDETVNTTGEDEITDGESSETVEPELIENDLYILEQDVKISDYVDGNVYAISDSIEISGKIGGDLYVLANKVTLTKDCYVYGNMYVCANEVSISGIVCDLYATVNNLTIDESAIVLRDARTLTSNMSINGSIGRSVYANTNTLSLGSSTHIYGNLNYTATQEIEVPSETIDGSVQYSEPSSSVTENMILSYALSFAYALVYTLVVFGLILLLAPKFKEKLYEISSKKWLASLGIGLSVAVVLPIVSLLLIYTIIGTPLYFAIMGLYLLILSITTALTTIALSKMLGDKVKVLSKFNNLFALLLVTIVLWGLMQIPYWVGIIVRIITIIYGFGIFTLSIFKKDAKE